MSTFKFNDTLNDDYSRLVDLQIVFVGCKFTIAMLTQTWLTHCRVTPSKYVIQYVFRVGDIINTVTHVRCTCTYSVSGNLCTFIYCNRSCSIAKSWSIAARCSYVIGWLSKTSLQQSRWPTLLLLFRSHVIEIVGDLHSCCLGHSQTAS